MHIVLNNYGSSIKKQDGQFLIQTTDGSKTLNPDKIRSITIGKGALISSDAALLAIDNEIDVLFIDTAGKHCGRLWSVKYGSVSTIRRKQIEFAAKPQAVQWLKELIVQKIDNQTALLYTFVTQNLQHKTVIDSAVNKLSDYKQKIDKLQATAVFEIGASLRGWEGSASRVYFGVMAAVVPASYNFLKRSHNRAPDLFNCLLNYAYGMLYGKVEGALIKAGLDPYAGIFHRDEYNRPVLAYDFVELYRVWADYVVINLAIQEIFTPDMYSINNGTYWLEQLGKRILIQSVNDYLDEIVKLNGTDRSRASHIDLHAQKFAQQLLNS